MGIPVANHHTAFAFGSVIKEVQCEACNCEYVYNLKRTATGGGISPLFLDEQGAAARAQDAARRSIDATLKAAVDVVACPSCGWYQKGMQLELKRKKFGRIAFYTVPIAGIFFLLGVIFGVRALAIPGIGCILVGMVGGYFWSLIKYDPNQGTRRAELAAASRGILKADYELTLAEASSRTGSSEAMESS